MSSSSLPASSSETSRRRKRLVIRLILAAILLGIVALAGVCWAASDKAIHPAEHAYKWSLSTYPDLHAEEVHFITSDGLTLEGRYFAGTKPAVIVLSHGYGDLQEQMLPFAHFLHEAGYSVLTYNMRGRGHSGGHATSLGAWEQKDLLSAVDYIGTAHPEVSKEIGAWGISLGGAVSILAAAQDQRIKSVVDDSGFSDAPNVISTAFTHFIGLPAFPFAPLTVGLSEKRLGIDINSVRPMDVVGKISPRPIFFIHNLGDNVVPPENTERNLAHALAPKSVWWIPGGLHANGHTIQKEEYEQRVVDFFNRSL
jgi:uncharacterized protein